MKLRTPGFVYVESRRVSTSSVESLLNVAKCILPTVKDGSRNASRSYTVISPLLAGRGLKLRVDLQWKIF